MIFGLGSLGDLYFRLAILSAVLIVSLSMRTFAQDTTAKPMSETAADNRQTIRLTEAETAMLSANMRQMLASVQGVTDGLARDDMEAVGAAASKSGMAMMQELPAQIRVKFPQSFMQMGMVSHGAFDQIAQEARVAVPARKGVPQLQRCGGWPNRTATPDLACLFIGTGKQFWQVC